MPPPSVTYFEIPVHDMGRAIRFYEAVLQLTLERTTTDGHPMALFPEPAEPAGITGALAYGDSYVPSRDGTRVYFTVLSIDDTLARALQAGGSVLYPKKDIGELGHVAEVQDTEGNRIGLFERRR